LGTTSSHLALGAELGLRYELSDSFDIELAQGLNRVDLNTMYGGKITISGFAKLMYKIQL
jgi:hypothetical protein